MRVLYVETAAGFGGSLTAILDTIDSLPEHIEPFLAIGYDPSAFRDIPDRLTYRVVSLAPPETNSDGRLRNIRRYAKTTFLQCKSLEGIVRLFSPNIIHANNCSAANLASAIVGRRHGIPVVSHQRGMEYAGLPNRLILRSKLFGHHIAVSQPIKQQLLSLGANPAHCCSIYDAIVPPGILNPPITDEREVVVAMYSMLLPWKGQESFLRAIAKVQRLVNVPFRVVIGGAEPFGETTYRQALERLCENLGLRDRVQFAGFRKNIYEELANTDILVLASVEPEPGGHIVQEAMMCGVPVVTTDDGGPAEYARASGAGHVVPRNDVERLAEAVAEMISKPAMRRDIAALAMSYARREFSPPAIAAKWVDVYNALAKSTNSYQ